jgi:error-prone DNA polymerase
MAYVELHCHSAFSFLDGASHPVELANAAAQQGHEALALTDHDGLHGAMEMAQALTALGIRPITGAEVTLDEGHHLTLLCEDAAGYRNLCRLLTDAYRDDRLEPSVPFEAVARHADGLVCLSGCARDGMLAKQVEQGRHSAARAAGERLVKTFGRDNLRVELQRPYGRRDRRRNRLLAQLADRLGVPTVATGNVHVHARERAPLQDVFVAVRLGTTLDESEPQRRGNRSHALAPPEAMAERFRDTPEAVHESGRLAERLRFDLTQDLGYRYPGSEDEEADRKLAELCGALLEERYAGRPSRADANARLGQELRVIRSLGLSGFFLLHRDLLELAREVAAEVRGTDAARAVLPPGRGRGSSVASIVCFLTGLSHVDPVENSLSLGRFLNEDLKALPDIDLDFPRDIRETLIPRVHERYGHDRSALVASFSTYRNRSAIRDFGKALGLPAGEIERAARAADPWNGGDIGEDFAQALGRTRVNTPRWQALVRLVRDANNLPRHVSQHPGGMVISTRPLIDICPIQPAAMEGRQMVHWDKESCADAGFLKIDLLGLGMLSAVERCVSEIARTRDEVIDLSRIDFEDERVYASIQRADTTGTFQIESRAQMQMLVRTKPESLDDLTVQVALVRPGPIIGGAVHPYIERRKALRADPSYRVPYEHPSLEPVLEDTLGAIVFQDQVIEVAMAFANFTAGEAEGLRRAMSRARSEAAMRAYEQNFIEGGMANGASREVAERVNDQIFGFSGFGFPKSHSAAFALLAYQSAWLREHYGPEFVCGLLNEQPMGFYPPDALVHEAQRREISVLAPDVLRSVAECRVEDGAVRIGLGYVNSVRGHDVKAIVAERERGGRFLSLADLAARCGACNETLERLAWAGACDSLVGGPPAVRRRTALWQLGITAAALPLEPRSKDGPVQLALPLEPADAPRLRKMTPWELLIADYGTTKITIDKHPLELMRPDLAADVLSSQELTAARHATRVKVAGLVVARQRPATAKGVTFMLLEDEHGTINLIVPPPIHDKFRLTVRAESLVLAEGKLERREGTTNVVVERIGRLERPDLPVADVRHIEPHRTWSSEAGADLRAVAPGAHSFGRRGR